MSSLYDDNIKYFDKGNLLAELIIIRNYTQINSFVVTGIGVGYIPGHRFTLSMDKFSWTFYLRFFP